MGSIGDCYDCEDCVRGERHDETFWYIKIFHNRRRRHSAFGMRTTIEYELLQTTPAAA